MSALQPRIDAVNARVSIAEVIGRAVKLSRHGKPRGKCPFHGSKSDSLAVYPDKGRARCWGCDWHGDAIGFVRDFYGLDFVAALERLEAELGLESGRPPAGGGRGSTNAASSGMPGALAANPVHRVKREHQRREVETVESAEVAKWLWAHSAFDGDALRTWLRARRVPEAMLGEEWIGGLRFCREAPIRPWAIGSGPSSVPSAPAMVALMRRIEQGEDGGRRFVACGVHVTYLSPGLTAKMLRKRADGSAMPARKMYGQSGGAGVLFGQYRPDAPLFVAEGIETTLSGMGLMGAAAEACGLAVLSLDNLQGRMLTRRRGLICLWDVRPDPERRGVCFAHRGKVTGLIDADMSPLAGPIDRETGKPRGFPISEWAGGPVVSRAITSEERSRICAALFARNWRDAGCPNVVAERPRMGMDFNDLAKAEAA